MHYNVVCTTCTSGITIKNTESKVDTVENGVISYRCRLLKTISASITFKAYQNGTTQSKKEYLCGQLPVLVFSTTFTPLCIQCFCLCVKIANAEKSCSVHEWKRSNVNKAVASWLEGNDTQEHTFLHSTAINILWCIMTNQIHFDLP